MLFRSQISRFRRSKASAPRGWYLTPLSATGINKGMIIALKITAERMAEVGECLQTIADWIMGNLKEIGAGNGAESRRALCGRLMPTRGRCARSFALKEKLLRCLGRGFTLFSCWPSARIIVGNTVVCAEICRRFEGGSAGSRAFLGNGGQPMHDMQIVQSA